MSCSGGPSTWIWKTWSITLTRWNPASSAATTTRVRSSARPGPPAGKVKSAMCRPIFTCCLLLQARTGARAPPSEPGTRSSPVRVPHGGTLRSRADPGRRSVITVTGHAGYEVVLLRHGETLGYDGDLGLTPLGERQAHERGTALAKEIAPGTDVRMPHARTARATATAVAV